MISYKPKNSQQQKIKSKNKERIDVIREELKELSYKLSRIKRNQKISLSDRKQKGFIRIKKTESILMN